MTTNEITTYSKAHIEKVGRQAATAYTYWLRSQGNRCLVQVAPQLEADKQIRFGFQEIDTTVDLGRLATVTPIASINES